MRFESNESLYICLFVHFQLNRKRELRPLDCTDLGPLIIIRPGCLAWSGLVWSGSAGRLGFGPGLDFGFGAISLAFDYKFNCRPWDCPFCNIAWRATRSIGVDKSNAGGRPKLRLHSASAWAPLGLCSACARQTIQANHKFSQKRETTNAAGGIKAQARQEDVNCLPAGRGESKTAAH